MGNVSSISPLDLKRRILVKGKVKLRKPEAAAVVKSASRCALRRVDPHPIDSTHDPHPIDSTRDPHPIDSTRAPQPRFHSRR